MRRKRLPALEIITSGIQGRGVRTLEALTKGQTIVRYTGKIYTAKEEARVRKEQHGDKVEDYVYWFTLNHTLSLDGDVPGNIAKLINHSCGPNCYSYIKGRDTHHPQVWIYANRDIEAGEELSFDYNFTEYKWYERPCNCGAPECMGVIVGPLHRRDSLRSKQRGNLVSALLLRLPEDQLEPWRITPHQSRIRAKNRCSLPDTIPKALPLLLT